MLPLCQHFLTMNGPLRINLKTTLQVSVYLFMGTTADCAMSTAQTQLAKRLCCPHSLICKCNCTSSPVHKPPSKNIAIAPKLFPPTKTLLTHVDPDTTQCSVLLCFPVLLLSLVPIERLSGCCHLKHQSVTAIAADAVRRTACLGLPLHR